MSRIGSVLWISLSDPAQPLSRGNTPCNGLESLFRRPLSEPVEVEHRSGIAIEWRIRHGIDHDLWSVSFSYHHIDGKHSQTPNIAPSMTRGALVELPVPGQTDDQLSPSSQGGLRKVQGVGSLVIPLTPLDF